LRIVHLSDIHVWRYAFNPMRLLSKRAVGMAELVLRRARKFRLERLQGVVERVRDLAPDHLLITGDLTTTALSAEFRDAHAGLADLLADPGRVTVIPGNHDRYTAGSVRHREFERWFGAFAPPGPYPWLREIGGDVTVLGLDATRSHLTPTGWLPPEQLARARDLVADRVAGRRLIVACHYPLAAPPAYARELGHKRLINAPAVADWMATIGPHLYCCGHVHAAWAFHPLGLPEQFCLNAGAPLLRDPTGRRPPGFLEITLGDPAADGDVRVTHHAWTGDDWSTRPLTPAPTPMPSRDPHRRG
jgi:3',5'-cyclic AMP phosphodiesterase CpdA